MTVYPDTSLLVAAFVNEDRSDQADAWLSANLSDLTVSGWLEVEFVSALAGKQRERRISEEQVTAAIAAYHGHIKPASQHLRVLEASFARAAEMITESASLRAGDALHLALAESCGVTLVTFDRQQAAAGQDLGVATSLL